VPGRYFSMPARSRSSSYGAHVKVKGLFPESLREIRRSATRCYASQCGAAIAKASSCTLDAVRCEGTQPRIRCVECIEGSQISALHDSFVGRHLILEHFGQVRVGSVRPCLWEARTLDRFEEVWRVLSELRDAKSRDFDGVFQVRLQFERCYGTEVQGHHANDECPRSPWSRCSAASCSRSGGTSSARGQAQF